MPFATSGCVPEQALDFPAARGRLFSGGYGKHD
jgi:hypothetical protein